MDGLYGKLEIKVLQKFFKLIFVCENLFEQIGNIACCWRCGQNNELCDEK